MGSAYKGKEVSEDGSRNTPKCIQEVMAAIEAKAFSRVEISDCICKLQKGMIILLQELEASPKTAIGHVLLPAGGTLSSSVAMHLYAGCKIIPFARRWHPGCPYRLSIRIYLNRSPPCDK